MSRSYAARYWSNELWSPTESLQRCSQHCAGDGTWPPLICAAKHLLTMGSALPSSSAVGMNRLKLHQKLTSTTNTIGLFCVNAAKDATAMGTRSLTRVGRTPAVSTPNCAAWTSLKPSWSGSASNVCTKPATGPEGTRGLHAAAELASGVVQHGSGGPPAADG